MYSCCTVLAMSSPVDSTCIKIGFDVGNDQQERADQTHTPRDCKGHRRVSLLSKALANPSAFVSQPYFYDDEFSETDDDVDCSDGDSSEFSSTVSSPIPIQCSQSRVAAGFAMARWQLRQQQRHCEQEPAQNAPGRQVYAARHPGQRS